MGNLLFHHSMIGLASGEAQDFDGDGDVDDLNEDGPEVHFLVTVPSFLRLRIGWPEASTTTTVL